MNRIKTEWNSPRMKRMGCVVAASAKKLSNARAYLTVCCFALHPSLGLILCLSLRRTCALLGFRSGLWSHSLFPECCCKDPFWTGMQFWYHEGPFWGSDTFPFYQIEPTLHCIDKIQLLINLSTQDRKKSEPTFRTFLGSKKYNEREWKIDDIEVIRKQGQRPHGHTLNPQHGTNAVFKIGCLSYGSGRDISDLS